MIEASLLLIAVFTLFVLVLINDFTRRIRRPWALTRAELLVIYVMQSVALGVAGLGQLQFLTQALGGAYRHATPENEWAETFHRYIPAWWVPDPAVLPAFYKGDSSLLTAPHLRGWLVPFLVWSGFICTLLFAFLCLNTLLRRHWVENERLPFPLVQLPLELTREGAARGLLSQGSFWLAVAAVIAFRATSTLHLLEPRFPQFPLFNTGAGQIVDIAPMLTQHPWNATGSFMLSFHPLIIGITYFVPQEASFSAWFFYLVVKGENVLAAALGYRGAGASAAASQIPYTAEQGAGAFLALGIFALWGARRHLADVWRKAIFNAPDVRDDDEALSYRAAVSGFGLSCAVLIAFATLGGLMLSGAIALFTLYLLMIVSVTRLRAEAAPMLNYGPDMNPHRMVIVLPGTQNWSAETLTPMAYLYWFNSDFRTVAMPPQMEALKMNDAERMLPPRALGRWILAASCLGVVAAFVSLLSLYYHYGASTPRGDNEWRLYNGILPFNLLMNYAENPKGPEILRMAWIAVGFLLTAGLAAARTYWLWWPFHPAGFAMAHAGNTMPWVWFPTLLGWLVKGLLLRYGGMSLYRKAIPFFLGLILGDIVNACLWSILGVVLDAQMYMSFPG